MPKQKQYSIEEVFNSFQTLTQQEQVDVFKLIQGYFKDQIKLIKDSQQSNNQSLELLEGVINEKK